MGSRSTPITEPPSDHNDVEVRSIKDAAVSDKAPLEKSATDARQGQTTGVVRWVLGIRWPLQSSRWLWPSGFPERNDKMAAERDGEDKSRERSVELSPDDVPLNKAARRQLENAETRSTEAAQKVEQIRKECRGAGGILRAGKGLGSAIRPMAYAEPIRIGVARSPAAGEFATSGRSQMPLCQFPPGFAEWIC
jgi:hypothetical protein